MKVNCLYDRLVPIAELKPNPKNSNKHPQEQIERLAKILEYQGWRAPVKVSRRSGFITAGHGRLLSAQLLGWTEVPVNFQDYESDEQEIADLVADNSIAAWSELDLSLINLQIQDMGPDFDIDLLGIKDFKIEFAEKLEPMCGEDDIPEKVEPRTKPGDVYRMGRHRLMCGDSTLIDNLEKLMEGKKADLWLTDPPYGVAYESSGRRGKDNQHAEIKNDSMPLEEMGEFWTSVATNALLSTTDKSSYYWFACQGGDQMMMMMMMSIGRANWKVRHELIWVKDQMVFGRSDYHYKHEPILYGWKKDGTHEWHSDRKQTSVLNFDRPKKSEEHPTMKPVELVEYLIGNSTSPGQLVLDTFGGSGTTMIAAEKSNRTANLMELEPKYCDVIVTRWENYTGQKAELIQ